ILNGTAVMAGLGCLLVADALQLLKDAEIAASVSFEALRGSPAPFDARLSRLKKQVGQHLVAGNMVKLLQDSEIVKSHKGPHRVRGPALRPRPRAARPAPGAGPAGPRLGAPPPPPPRPLPPAGRSATPPPPVRAQELPAQRPAQHRRGGGRGGRPPPPFRR